MNDTTVMNYEFLMDADELGFPHFSMFESALAKYLAQYGLVGERVQQMGAGNSKTYEIRKLDSFTSNVGPVTVSKPKPESNKTAKQQVSGLLSRLKGGK